MTDSTFFIKMHLMYKRILTIQDISCVGQCSLTVALPIISACGIETAILPSSVLSNHTSKGFKGFTFNDLTDDMPVILNQWIENGINFDGFYTGYVSKKQIPIILEIINKTARQNSIKIVDPVMADNGILYSGFDSSFPAEMKKLCVNADFILPNLTEACFLLGIEYPGNNYDHTFIEKICSDLYKLGCKNVILTGVSFDDSKLGVAIYNGTTTDYIFTKKLPVSMHGTGDAFASAFTGSLIQGNTSVKSAEIAANFVVKAMEATIDDKSHWYGVKFEKALPYLIENINK